MIAISARLAASRLHYAWVIIALTFVVIVVTAGVRATPGVLIVPFEAEFGWSRTTISMAISVNILLYGLIGPFAAGFINRYGPRRVLAAAAVVLGLGTLATITIRHPWQLFALWAYWWVWVRGSSRSCSARSSYNVGSTRTAVLPWECSRPAQRPANSYSCRF